MAEHEGEGDQCRSARVKWKSPNGAPKEAWVVDKRDADAFHTTTAAELRAGTHTADRASSTITKAGELWLANARNVGLSACRARAIGATSNPSSTVRFTKSGRVVQRAPASLSKSRSAMIRGHEIGPPSAAMRSSGAFLSNRPRKLQNTWPADGLVEFVENRPRCEQMLARNYLASVCLAASTRVVALMSVDPRSGAVAAARIYPHAEDQRITVCCQRWRRCQQKLAFSICGGTRLVTRLARTTTARLAFSAFSGQSSPQALSI